MSSSDLNAVFYSHTYHPIQAGSIDGTDIVPHDNAVYRAVIASSTGLYDPLGDAKAQGDPHCIVFVGRLSRDTTEETLLEAMSKYGRIKNLRLVRHIVTGASQGYAFVEYETEKEMRHAFELAHHMIIDGNQILVDYNRQLLMPGWIPRRLGGGLGGRKESGQLRFGGRDRPFRKPLRPIPEKELEKLGIPLPGNYMQRWQLPPLPKRRARQSDDKHMDLEYARKSSERDAEKTSSKESQFQEDRRRKRYENTEGGHKRKERHRDDDHRESSVRYNEDDYRRQHHSRRSSRQERESSDWNRYQDADQKRHGSRFRDEQENTRNGKKLHGDSGDDDERRYYNEKHEREKFYEEDERHGTRYEEKRHHHRKRDRKGSEKEVRDHRTRHGEEDVEHHHHHHNARQDDAYYDHHRKARQDDVYYDQERYDRESSREHSRQDKRRRVERISVDKASLELQRGKYKERWDSREPSLENRWNPSEREHVDDSL